MSRKVRRRPKKKLFVLIITVALILIGAGVYIVFMPQEKVKEAKVISKISSYGYTLKSNKSKEYKALFQKLKEVLTGDEIDEDKYAKVITKMFITDFYSLNDHVAKTDIGGVEFVHPDIVDNFIVNAQDTYYKNIESNIYKQRKQSLPKVNKIKIESVKTTEYSYNDNKEEEAKEVKATWTYTSEDFSDYQNKATLIYVHNGKNLVLVELD